MNKPTVWQEKLNKKTEMNSTGISRKSHDAYRLRNERYERCLVGAGPVQGRIFQVKRTVSVHLGTAGGSQTPRAVGAGSMRPNSCPWVLSGSLAGPGDPL